MSSSRIIKGAAQFPMAEFRFGAVQPGGFSDLPAIPADDFQRMFSAAPLHGDCGQPSEVPHQAETAVPSGVEMAEEELHLLLQEAADRGFADGRREAEESFSAICRTFSETVESLSGLRERIVRESEEDLLRLAMMVAKQVIRHEISQDRKLLAQFVSEAAASIGDQGDITICFHPEDYRHVTANRQFYLAGVGDKVQATIKPDEQVSPGGCVIETPTGVVDARVETQLAEIFKRLMQERGHGGDGPLELPVKADQYLTEQRGAEKYACQQD